MRVASDRGGCLLLGHSTQLHVSRGLGQVWRRYSEFVALHEHLSALGFTLPPLPPKSFFSRSDAVLRERETGLTLLLDEISQRSLMTTHPVMQKFLGLGDPGVLN